ncbi:YdcF family protein [Hufsiella ginkgonis]|uniref:YdcF family protein n=1 Tax=Hufsiella ginkgonis TaxID=2695274 RepID=A0A7K1XT16_9SPHI|nr:YdcF family protein [Hufsiella ginkgonis]MXV14094.1 YdcF family protein [Hufsiella ginkgonis]
MKHTLLSLSLLFLCAFAAAQDKTPKAGYQFVKAGSWVQVKNFYLLTLLEQDKAANTLLAADSTLVQLSRKRQNAVASSVTACKDIACFTTPLKFSDQEITQLSAALTRLYKPGNALGDLVKNHLLPSGMYLQYHSLTLPEILVKAWEQDARAVNYTVGVYLEGNKPNYPLIDSISFNTRAPRYAASLHTFSSALIAGTRNSRLFFQLPMQAALLSLEINERNHAGEYEPMAATINKTPFVHIKEVTWDRYPYSAIIVPGAGPDDPNTPLSAAGMLRCRLAAAAFRAGKAPFLIVSGGRVHPYKTKWNEAIEMQDYLVKVLGIPENAVIAEPHARHTTTNMRNGIRLMFRYGMPFTKTGLIITDKFQSDFIMTMDERCRKELGYVPYKLGRRVSDTGIEFLPLTEAMRVDADEPMDP